MIYYEQYLYLKSMRTFKTGATRNDDSNWISEGFLSPIALEKFAEYMNENRIQADGNVRDSDNWQKGIDLDMLHEIYGDTSLILESTQRITYRT